MTSQELLNALLTAMDTPYSTSFGQGEIELWPSDARDALLHSLVLRRGISRNFAECSACGYSHAVHQAPPRGMHPTQFFYDCPLDGRQTLNSGDLHTWELHAAALAGWLASELDAGSTFGELVLDRLWQVGTSLRGKLSLLARGAAWPDGAHLFGEYVSSDTLFVLLTPSRPQYLAGASACLSASDLLTIRDKKLWADTSMLFQASDGLRAPKRDELYVFRRVGPAWELRYAGGAQQLVADEKGMAYIGQMLSAPHRKIQLHEFIPAVPVAQEAQQAVDLIASGSIEMANTLIDGDAPDTLKTYKKALAKLEDERGRLLQRHKSREAEQKASEIAIVQQIMSKRFDNTGQVREKRDPHKRIRQSITVAIRRAIAKIKETDRECGAHLDTALETGSVMRYTPEEPISWST